MPYMSRETKRNIVLFLLMLLAAELVNIWTSPATFPTSGLASILYCGILIAWALTIHRRTVQRTIRRCLIAVSLSLVLLFLLRMVRYVLVPAGTVLSRWLWYWYYIPMSVVPLLVFFCALCVGKTDGDRPLHRARWLWLPCGLLAVGIVTNDLHHWAFYSDLPLAGNGAYSYGWLYLISVVWQTFLILSAFFVTLRRCRLSQCRRMAWLPILPVLLFFLLLLLYWLEGGAPELYGHKLYNFQEVYCFGFIAFWECCVQIGLIPTNTGYGEIFDLSTVQATLAETDGGIVYHSQNAVLPTTPQMQAARNGAARIGDHLYLRSASVSGGAVYWTEDHAAIDEMNDDLAEATERIEEENELIEEENRILEEKTRYETQNRLYDQIAYRTHDRLVRIDELLHTAADDEATFRRNLAMSTVLGAYVKRRGNLTILAADRNTLPLRDVLLSIRESMEYLSVLGVDCDVHSDREAELPAETALLCYDLFEAVVEAALPDVSAMLVRFSAEGPLQMTVMLDRPRLLPDAAWERERLAARQGKLSVEEVYDGVLVRLSFREGASE